MRVNKIDESCFHVEDLIGRVYEYFLQVYAASGTKEDGEFYTPACVVQLIAELIEPYSGVVYDPCCGSGGMFVQSHKFVKVPRGTKNISVIGQESVQETWRLCKMNLAIRGISHNLGEKRTHPPSRGTCTKTKRLISLWQILPLTSRDGAEDQLLDDPRWRGYGISCLQCKLCLDSAHDFQTGCQPWHCRIPSGKRCIE